MAETTKKKVCFAPLPSEIQNKQVKPKEKENDEDSFEADSESNSSEKAREKAREEEIIKSRKEWEEIEKQQKESKESLPTENGVGGTKIDYSTSITFFDARIYLIDQSKDIECEIPQIKYTSKNCFCLTSEVQQCAKDAYQEMYKITRLTFDDKDLTHFRILTSLHIAITGILSPPPRTGENWVDIGFQTKDPVTDLRGTGMLGLLLPLGLFAKFKALGQRIISISRGDTPFPLMLVIIVYVSETIQAANCTDLLKDAKTKEEGWHNMLLYLAGLVSILATEWMRDNLDFEHDFDRFNQIPARGLSNVENVLQVGRRAEMEDEKISAPALKEDINGLV